MLPGLINCHVHLAFGVGLEALSAVQNEPDDAKLLLAMTGHARQLLEAGVTTARDLGDRSALAVRLRDAIAAGQVPGPRLLTATAPLTPAGELLVPGRRDRRPTDPDALRRRGPHVFGGASQPRGCSGSGFGFGPGLLDEMTTTKAVHVSEAR